MSNYFNSVRFFRVPFDWRNPIGYLIVVCILLAGTYATFICVMPIVVFLIGCCWLFIAFVKDISNDLPLLNEFKTCDRQIQQQRIEAFCNIIELFSDAKQLSRKTHKVLKLSMFEPSAGWRTFLTFFIRFVDEFNSIYEFITTGYFLWALLNTCSSLLAFQIQLVEYTLSSQTKRQSLSNN